MYTIILTNAYEKEINKWDKSERDVAEKIPKKLAENPYIGKPLNYPFLREKKIKEKRIYYLIYDDLKLVLLIATSDKKDQQEVINFVKNNLSEFRKVAEEISKQIS